MTGETINTLPAIDCPATVEKAAYGVAPCRTFTWGFTVAEQANSNPVVIDGTTISVVNTVISPDLDASGNLPVFEVTIPPGMLMSANLVWDHAPACPPVRVSRVTACKTDCCTSEELEYCWSAGNAVNVLLCSGRFRFRPHEVNECLDMSTIGTTFSLFLSLEPIDRDYLAVRAANSAGCGCGGYAHLIGVS